MNSMDISRLVVSKILNHVESGLTAVYDRHSYDAEKRHTPPVERRFADLVAPCQRCSCLFPSEQCQHYLDPLFCLQLALLSHRRALCPGLAAQHSSGPRNCGQYTPAGRSNSTAKSRSAIPTDRNRDGGRRADRHAGLVPEYIGRWHHRSETGSRQDPADCQTAGNIFVGRVS